MEERVLTFRLHSSGQTYADALQAARYRQESSRSVGEICMRMFNPCTALSDDKSQPSCDYLPWRTLLFFTMVAAGVITRYKHKKRSRQCDMFSCFGTDVAIVCQHKVLRVLRCIIHTCLMLSYRSFHHYFLHHVSGSSSTTCWKAPLPVFQGFARGLSYCSIYHMCSRILHKIT